MLSSWQINLLNIFLSDYSPFYSYIENNSFCWTLNLSLTVFLSPFPWLPIVCMSQLFLEEPGKAPVSSRERAAFLRMKISGRYIKGGIFCRWVDLVAPSVLSCSFIQSMYYFKTDAYHENHLQDLHYPLEYFIDYSLNLVTGMWQTNWYHMVHNCIMHLFKK